LVGTPAWKRALASRRLHQDARTAFLGNARGGTFFIGELQIELDGPLRLRFAGPIRYWFWLLELVRAPGDLGAPA